MFKKKCSISFTLLSIFLSSGSHIHAEGDDRPYPQITIPVNHTEDEKAYHRGDNSNNPSSSHQHNQQDSHDPGYHTDQYGNKIYHNQRDTNMQKGQQSQQNQYPKKP